jgi:hypothetical protein
MAPSYSARFGLSTNVRQVRGLHQAGHRSVAVSPESVAPYRNRHPASSTERCERDEHPRALRIAQALLTALEARAYDVSGADDGVRVTVLEEPLAIAIEEGTKRVEHRVSFTEQKLIDSGRGWQVPTHDEVPQVG